LPERLVDESGTVVVIETDVTDADGRPVAKVLQTQVVLTAS
jgi:hypothetical protein